MWLYRFVRWLTGLALSVFYKGEVIGESIPAEGPIILVANHPNGLIDPVLVVHVSPRPVRLLGKAPLFKMPLIGFLARGMRALPVYRRQDDPTQTAKNEETFEAAWDALQEGSAVCIFPEGVSHSVPHLQKVRTGAARIALGAEGRAGFKLGVRIVPLGLTYQNKHLFRGHAVVEVGKPIAVADLAELNARDPVAAVKELTLRIGRALESLTINVETWEDLPLIEAAEGIYSLERPAADVGKSRKLEDRIPRLRRFAEGLALMRETANERVNAVVDRVVAYRDRLNRLGLRSEDLDARYSAARILRFTLRNLAAILFGLPLATIGAIFFYLPYQFPRFIVAVVDPPLDVMATVKILASCVIFPIWYIGLLVLSGLTFGLIPTLVLAVLLPIAGLYAIHFRERREEAFEDAAVFFRLVTRRALRDRLLARRAELARQIEELKAEVEKLQVGGESSRAQAG
jgi:glycerol-3-phosphate O-acyltransferase / dihydroxyacetone phosphate acyltransferase